jgi:hypothetical protein
MVRPSSLPPVQATERRFLRPNGKADLPVLFSELLRRMAERPDLDLNKITYGLNYEIIAEQKRWRA